MNNVLAILACLLLCIQTTKGQTFLDQFNVPTGNPKKIVTTYVIEKDGNKKEVLTTTYTFEGGHIASKKTAYPKASKNKTKTYNFSGNTPVDITVKNGNGAVTAKWYINVNFSNQISGFTEMTGQNETVLQETYKYDDNRVVKIITKDGDGKEKSTVTFQYNRANQCVKKVTTKKTVVTSFVEFTYNKQGQIKTEKMTHNEFNYLNYLFTYLFNDQGDMVTTAMSSGDAQYVEYTYDEKGNWVTKKSWFKKSADSKDVYTRQITY